MEETITVKEASEIAGVTMGTIRRWIKDFKIGVKIGGRWKVFVIGLKKVLTGEFHYNYKQGISTRVNKIYGVNDEKIG